MSAAKLIDHTVFDSFKTLTSSVDADRFKGSLSLLQHLNRSKDEQQVTYKCGANVCWDVFKTHFFMFFS